MCLPVCLYLYVCVCVCRLSEYVCVVCVCLPVYVCVCVCLSVYLSVCVWEREKEREHETKPKSGCVHSNEGVGAAQSYFLCLVHPSLLPVIWSSVFIFKYRNSENSNYVQSWALKNWEDSKCFSSPNVCSAQKGFNAADSWCFEGAPTSSKPEKRQHANAGSYFVIYFQISHLSRSVNSEFIKNVCVYLIRSDGSKWSASGLVMLPSNKYIYTYSNNLWPRTETFPSQI